MLTTLVVHDQLLVAFIHGRHMCLGCCATMTIKRCDSKQHGNKLMTSTEQLPHAANFDLRHIRSFA